MAYLEEMEDFPKAEEEPERPTSFGTVDNIVRMTFATLIHGLGTGVIGIGVALLIKHVQGLGFGSENGGFLKIASEAPDWRRFSSVAFAGVFSAVAWYWLRGREPAFVPVEECMQGAKMPPVVTLINGAIQDISVALGGTFGREAAPREIAAMWGSVIADGLRVSEEQRRILVACGAGAGLAAVYSVPISGTLYTIEHILDWDMSFGALAPAIITSCIATVVSADFVEIDGLYHMPRYSQEWPSSAMIIWAFAIGPVCGLAAALFSKLIKFARSFRPSGRFTASYSEVEPGRYVWLLRSREGSERVRQQVEVMRKTEFGIWASAGDTHEDEFFTEEDWNAAAPQGRRNWHILLGMPAAFLLLALLSLRLPTLLGNGRALAEVSIHRLQHGRSVAALVFDLVLKVALTAAAIASGVDGGTLTPSVAIGATLGAVIGAGWHESFPVGPPREDEKAIIASVAFLAPAMRSPVTALWLIVEFTAQGVYREELAALYHGDVWPVLRSKFAIGILIPMCVAVSGAMILFDWFLKTEGSRDPSVAPSDGTHSQETQGRSGKARQSLSMDGANDLDLGEQIVHLRRLSTMRDIMSISEPDRRLGYVESPALEQAESAKAKPLEEYRKYSRMSEGDVEDASSSNTWTPLNGSPAERKSQGTQTPTSTCESGCYQGFSRFFRAPRALSDI